MKKIELAQASIERIVEIDDGIAPWPPRPDPSPPQGNCPEERAIDLRDRHDQLWLLIDHLRSSFIVGEACPSVNDRSALDKFLGYDRKEYRERKGGRS